MKHTLDLIFQFIVFGANSFSRSKKLELSFSIVIFHNFNILLRLQGVQFSKLGNLHFQEADRQGVLIKVHVNDV